MQATTVSWEHALNIIEPVVGRSLEITSISPEEALSHKDMMLTQPDIGSFFGALGMVLLAEPAHGYTGFDVSEEAVDFGIQLESLHETLKSTLSSFAQATM
jgi:hypothetical protein